MFIGNPTCSITIYFNQTTEKAIIRKEKHLEEDEDSTEDEEVIYKIDVPANRY